ncbi:MAG: imidazolonepropionase [Candidatus Limnocylindrales bacterium]
MNLRVLPGGRGEVATSGILIVGAAQVATLAGGLRRGGSQGRLALLSSDDAGRTARDRARDERRAPVVATWESRIVSVGPRARVERELADGGYPMARFAVIDATGGVVTPGLVDPHTHLLFAGTRERELLLRQAGAGYLEILEAGGGILSTVAATRAASDDALAAHGRRWLGEMLRHGTTTIEAKSGYGLDLRTELRLLEIAYRLGREGPIDVVPTYLGAHAVPQEFRVRPDGTEAYVRHILEEQLPGVAAQGRARFCDVFCEAGVFTADQSRRILAAAAAFGMAPRLHADELAPSGGAELAAEIGAASADHLATPSDAGIAALAAAAGTDRPVIATLLPATTWFLMKEHHAPARRFIEAGVPVALGTDFNPGTSPTASLPLVMTVACLTLALSPAEALVAVTINAAHAVGLADEIGSIEPGKQADLVIWGVPSVDQIPYWPGADLVRMVIKRGRVVHERPT